MEMKMTRQILPILILCLLGFYFCKKPNKQPSPSPVQKAEAFLPQGKWQVTYFIENGNDKGKDLKGYDFTFGADGSVSAERSGQKMRGAWVATQFENRQNLMMSFVVWPTDGLSKAWQITEANNEKIHLVNKGESKEKSHLILERKKASAVAKP
jgi:hypothetical protein